MISTGKSLAMLDRQYYENLRGALQKVADDLALAAEADGAFIAILEEDQRFSPLLAGGRVTETERAVFMTATLDPETDVLVYRMLGRPVTLISNLVETDPRVSPSIVTQLGVSAVVSVPVMREGRLAGLVLVVRRGQNDPFTHTEVRMVEWFATAIALALENARLYHETQARLAESQALHQVTLALLHKLELEEVLQIICDEALHLTHASGSAVALLEDDGWLRIPYSTGEVPEMQGRVRVDKSVIGSAVRKGEAVLVNHPAQENLSGLPMSVLAVPLRSQNRIVGVLQLTHQGQAFTPEDVRLIQIFADQAAVAIEHARLTRQVQEMAILEERHRLSRELHDSVNQLLYSIMLYSEATLRQMEQADWERARHHVERLRESAQEALKEMRMLIFELRPSILGQLGLRAALEQRLRSVEEQVGLNAALKWRVNSPLDKRLEETLYGIAQEALNNIVKHAQARNLFVHVVQSGQSLILRIEDDGVGMDVENLPPAGMGLKTMRERAEAAGGKLSLQSTPGQGTVVTFEVSL